MQRVHRMSVWTECPKGHDLTVPFAWLYDSQGKRSCRECAKAVKKKERSRGTLGSFDKGT